MYPIKQATLTCLLVIIQLSLFSQYKLTDNCEYAWEAIIDLKFADADSIIEVELVSNPNNYYCTYLRQTSEAFQFMINMSDDAYDNISDNYEERMNYLEGNDIESPYYLSCQAEMQLQMGMFNIIYGDRLSGLKKAFNAYNKTYKNIEKYPNFNQGYKLDGIFNVAISNMPPFVNWAITFFGVSGSYVEGYRILEKYFKNCEGTTGIDAEAALYNILAFKLNKDPKSAYEFINTLDSNYLNLTLLKYFQGNVAYRLEKNEEAYDIISSIPVQQDDFYFNSYNYMMGKILLRKLDTNCRNYFSVYLNNQKELQYHKEINYLIALSYLMEDNLENFERYKQISEDKGNEISERDREAVCDYDRDFIPNIYIARAKLLILGGYYDNAEKELRSFKNSLPKYSSNSPFELEYNLLKGRIEANTGNPLQAQELYGRVIEDGGEENYQFASEAAMLLGLLLETKNAQLSIDYFKLARKLYKSGYYEYIDEISKKKIEELKSA